jgi:hypothetical protein
MLTLVVRSVLSLALATTALSLAASSVAGQALAEPPAGKWVLGMWPRTAGFPLPLCFGTLPDTTFNAAEPDPGYQETPASLNERTGIRWGAFQLSQPIPVPRYDFVSGVAFLGRACC